MATKKGFKKGVDFFLTGNTDQEGQEISAMSDTARTDADKNTDTNKYTHTYIDTHAEVPLRPLPAMPRGERKTRRLNLLVRPSMFDKLSAIAARMDSSVNDLINNILEDFTVRNAVE